MHLIILAKKILPLCSVSYFDFDFDFVTRTNYHLYPDVSDEDLLALEIRSRFEEICMEMLTDSQAICTCSRLLDYCNRQYLNA